MKELNTMTAKELKEMAKGMKISNWWNLKKEVLIKKIEEVQNMSAEETEERNEEIKKENELFEHYSKHWRKYGPTNNWTKFKKDYEAGKIELVEDKESIKIEDPIETENLVKISETIAEAHISVAEEVSEKPKENIKAKIKKSNLKLTELTYKGETKSIREWAKELEMPWPTLYDRVNRNGWTTEEAIEIPLGGRRKR